METAAYEEEMRLWLLQSELLLLDPVKKAYYITIEGDLTYTFSKRTFRTIIINCFPLPIDRSK